MKEFYDLSKTWFKAVPDESAEEVQGQAKVNESQGAHFLPPTPPPVIASTDSKGETLKLPAASQDYEGRQLPASTRPSKARVTFDMSTGFDKDKSASTDSKGDKLVMPDMINLETLGMRRSPRMATQERKQYTCRTSLMKLCAFGMLMASSVANPIAVLSRGQACVMCQFSSV